jgi:hypothetical protein
MRATLRLPLFAGMLLALLLPAALPAGWMPQRSAGGLELRLCSEQGLATIQFDPGKADSPGNDTPCPFAIAPAVPVPPTPFPVPQVVALPFLFATPALASLAIRLAWARPPPTAPPSSSSA